MSQANADDLQLLQRSLRDWISECAALVAGALDARGTGEQARQIAEMGWPGVAIAAEHGGSELGWSGLGLLLVELGRELVPTSLLGSNLLAEALRSGGTAAQCAELLPALAAGDISGAFAIDEHAHHAPQRISTCARRSGDGWRIDGRKSHVAGGNTATHLLLAAQLEDGVGIALFLVPASAVTRSPQTLVDGRDYAALQMDAVELPADARLGGAELYQRVLDLARIGTAAEMLGAAERALEITVDYLKLRRQFDQPIGSFQALQHRAALMRVEVEMTRCCVDEALQAIDAGNDAALPTLAAVTKATAGDTLHRVSGEIVQMHGGIGMTDAHVAGRYLKYARVAEALYGNAAAMADRYARLHGF